MMTYSVDVSLTRFNDRYRFEEFETAVDDVMRTWSAVANIDFVKVSNSSVRNADGSYKSGLAYGSHIDIRTTLGEGTRLEEGGVIGLGGIRGGQGFAWMDAGEQWAPDAWGRGAFSYWVLAAHEVGHALRLSHVGDGLKIMNPTLTSSHKGIYSSDIAAIQASTGYGGTGAFGAREWSDTSDDAFYHYVKVGQTIDTKG